MKVYFWTLAAGFAAVFSVGTTVLIASAGIVPSWLT
jgi:hypothetical protein